MEKPVKKTRSYYDYHDCMDYLKEKYNFNPDNYAGRNFSKHDYNRPYLDFWHWVLDAKDAHNGATISFSNEDLYGCDENDKTEGYPEYKGWRSKILEYILSEFGEGDDRECDFEVSW